SLQSGFDNPLESRPRQLLNPFGEINIGAHVCVDVDSHESTKILVRSCAVRIAMPTSGNSSGPRIPFS
ncbi:MAG TPA: hypothetical protein VGX71_22880, partial [Pseudaminobacter sp.]|nr:hypothetical protein [Pseudaminobacter sp.]